VEKLDGIANLSLNAIKDIVGVADSITIKNFANSNKTVIWSGRNVNSYRVEVGADFEGDVHLNAGLQYSGVVGTESGIPTGLSESI
jgi:hypothetical protein